MKLNWGTGIAIFYTAFVLFMVGMVIHSKSFDHSLVMDNYYEEDLQYQSHIDAVKNAQGLETDLEILKLKEDQVVLFRFPANFEQLEGSLWFYRADDEQKDFRLKIKTDGDGQQLVATSDLTPGLWKVKVNWTGDGKPFYKEEIIVL